MNGEKSNLWKHKKPDPKQFHTARDGDHLLTPFQCDVCVFRRVYSRSPDGQSLSDQLGLAYIRRANLDAFWSRAAGTVRNNKGIVRRSIEELAAVGLQGPYFDPGPTPSVDHAGYEAAIAMLMDTRKAGKYSESHKQWQSSRKVRSAVSNFEKTHLYHPLSGLALVDEEKGRTTRFHFGGNSSLWFDRFMQGSKARMGQDVRQNLALSTELWKEVLNQCERKARTSNSLAEGSKYVVVGAYSCFALVLSLRGPEGFMFEISLLLKHRQRNNDLVWLPIIGKLKGDSKEETHYLRSVPVTGSGINVEKWRDWLLITHIAAGREEGPAMSGENGYLLNAREVNEVIWDILEDVYDARSHEFPKAVENREDIRDLIDLDRSFRRSSESRATKMGVAEPDKNIVNRWSGEVRAKGKKASEALSIHYADQNLLDDCFRRCTQAQ